MFVEKHGVQHTHSFKKGYRQTRNGSGVVYILFWVCTSCPYREAYDLSHEEPRK